MNNLYTFATMNSYVQNTIREMPPHLYAIGKINTSQIGNISSNHKILFNMFYSLANDVVEKLNTSHTSQSIIVSGETGSGKSETVKHLTRYLAHATPMSSQIEEKMTIITKILEAFGNAKTAANNNSSRFGKSIEVSAQYRVFQKAVNKTLSITGTL